MENAVQVKGFYHLQIEEDGRIVGDSGWLENTVVNDGFNNFLVKSLGSIAGSAYVSHINVGTGTAPAAANTSLSGEVTGTNGAVQRAAVTAATSSTSKTLRFTGTMSSANSFVTTSENISNVGLFGHSTAASLFAGNTYASSSVATNQNVNVGVPCW